MKKLVFFSVLIGFLFTMTCCKKESPLVLKAEIKGYKDLVPTVKADDKVILAITAYSGNNIVNRLRIKELTKQGGETVLLDSIGTTKQMEFNYIYTAPSFSDSTMVTLQIYAQNTAGDAFQINKYILVAVDDSKIIPTDAITLYSSNSSGQSAFSMRTLSTFYLDKEIRDSIDLYDVADSLTHIEFRKEWASKTGMSFARFNDFNYGEATAVTIKNAYKSANKSNAVKNIKNDDVILVGFGNKAMGVIKVFNVYDEPGDVENNRYIFSVKKIQK